MLAEPMENARAFGEKSMLHAKSGAAEAGGNWHAHRSSASHRVDGEFIADPPDRTTL